LDNLWNGIGFNPFWRPIQN